MDGPTFRARYAANLLRVCDTLVRHFSEDNPETKQLLAAVTAVGESIGDLSNPAELRAPSIALANLIGDLEPAFYFDSFSWAKIVLARMLIKACGRLVGDVTHPGDVANAAPMPRSSSLTFADILAHFPSPPPMGVLLPQQQPQQDGSAAASVIDLPTSGPVVPWTGMQTRSRSAALAIAPASAQAPANNAGNIDPTKKKCNHCNLMVGRDHTSKLQHAWKKHKDQVYKLLKLVLVCSVPYCDYVGSTVLVKKIHEGRTHGAHPAAQQDIIQELEPGPCRYCGFHIDTLTSFKKHTLRCKQRDSRAPLGCTSCDKEFHFIYDFVTHLRIKGGLHHGKPVPRKN